MKNKSLRKTSKKELLEILLEQAKKIEELELKLNETQQALDSKLIAIEETGSLAEAALKLNGIFEVAQQTAEQYLLNVKEKCKKIENDAKNSCLVTKNTNHQENEKVCKQKKKKVNLDSTVKTKKTSNKLSIDKVDEIGITDKNNLTKDLQNSKVNKQNETIKANDNQNYQTKNKK